MPERKDETPDTSDTPDEVKPKRTVKDIMKAFKEGCESEPEPETSEKPRLTRQSTTLEGYDEQVKEAMRSVFKKEDSEDGDK